MIMRLRIFRKKEKIMLLTFKTKNFKSFKEELVFSMTPARYQTGLDFSILKQNIGKKEIKALSSAVIYGPNAAGKTNIISAMDVLRSIVLRGNIKNSDLVTTPNFASSALELIPNCDTVNMPTEFSISFSEMNRLIEYKLVILLGNFLEKDFNRKIVKEQLLINGKDIFIRDNNELIISTNNLITNNSDSNNSETVSEIAKNSLSEQELFLCNGFKTIFSKELVSIIQNWFENKFIVICGSNALETYRKLADPQNNSICVEKTLTNAAKEFGITANALGYISHKDDVQLYSFLEKHNKGLALPAKMFESYGTIRFINEFPLVLRTLMTGATLVMDEFDASIHPMALMNIINIFHNDEINTRKAQLIFNTHNPIFLDASLFRRDEIKFVEKDEVLNSSVHYSLSDFKTASGIRKGEDYMNNYFINRYGAIKDVDFSAIIKSVLDSNKGDC